MATWPATLPKPQADDYTVKPVDQTIRTEMEAGNVRVRRRFTRRRDHIGCICVMDKDQFATFREWFYNPDEANGGASWFTTDILITGVVDDFESVDARFLAPWEASYIQMHYTVSFSLEVEHA